MNPDWLSFTTDALTREARVELLTAVWNAHRESAALNQTNASSMAAVQAGWGSGSVLHAVCAAMLSTGNTHAPVTQARHTIFTKEPPDSLDGRLVPGFGNSFHRTRIDPVWEAAAELIRVRYPGTWAAIDKWSQFLLREGKPSAPNAAAFTAAVSELVGWPWGMEPLLVVEPRIMVWAQLAGSVRSGKAFL